MPALDIEQNRCIVTRMIAVAVLATVVFILCAVVLAFAAASVSGE